MGRRDRLGRSPNAQVEKDRKIMKGFYRKEYEVFFLNILVFLGVCKIKSDMSKSHSYNFGSLSYS